MGNQRACNKGYCQPRHSREGRHCLMRQHFNKRHSPPERQMEGEGAVALHKDEEPHRRAQPHDQGPTHCGCIQCSGTCQQRKYADDCQNDNDDAALRCLHAHARLGQLTSNTSLRSSPGELIATNACMMHQLRCFDDGGVKAQDAAPPLISNLAVMTASGFSTRDIYSMMQLYTYCENNQTHPKLLYTCLPNCKKIRMNSRTMHGYWWYKGRRQSQTLSADLLVAV